MITAISAAKMDKRPSVELNNTDADEKGSYFYCQTQKPCYQPNLREESKTIEIRE